MEIPGYIIDKQIGKGGMARVYLARHEGLDRLVAIKVMNRQMDDDDNDFSERFMREARIVAGLTHRNIVTVYDVGLHDGHHYIAMEYLPGGITLDHKLKDGITPEEGLSTIKQIASALGFAHSKDIVHRDVKPENIMYREDGSAVLTDFGIAKATTSATKMTATGTVIGTPHYMSPEQAQGHEIGSFSDIYSLGIVCYEILTGEVPYDAESTIAVVFKHITEPVPALEGDLQVYQPIIDRMMAKTREERYTDCDQLIADIDNVTGGGAANNATMINNATTINKAVTLANAKKGTRGMAAVAGDVNAEQSKSDSTKKAIIAVIATITILAIGGGGYFYLQQSAEQEQQAKLLQRQQRDKQAALTEQKELSEKKALQDKKQKEEGRLTEQQRLKDEKKRLAELKVKQEADKLVSQKAAQEAAQLKAKQDAKNTAAKKAADKKWRDKQNKISALLATAEKQLLNGQLDKAYKTYQSTLKLDSKNKRANSGVNRVASQHLSKANVAAAGYDFDTANKHISTVIKISPSHSKLASTQEKVFEYKNEQLVKKAEAARKTEIEKQASAEPEETEKKPRRSFGGF